jgi:hypothetical protein
MPDSKFWWFRYTESGKRHAVSLRTSDEAEAITRAQAILAEGLIASEAYTPSEPAPRRREIHDLINQYLKDAQNRHKKPLRAVTADVHQSFSHFFRVSRQPSILIASFWRTNGV